jgi:ABC-2 type transport system permease protein
MTTLARTLAGSARGTDPLLAYLRLEVRRTLRNRRYLVFTIVMPVALYVLYTAILPVAGDATKDGLAWPAYFLVSMAAYGAIGASMSQAAPIAVERRQGWARQLRTTPLPGWAYVAAKLASAVVLTLPALALVAAAGVLVEHVQLGGGALAMTVLVLAIASVPFAALGLLIGYLLDADSAQGGMVLAFFTLAILGGLFAPLDAFPAGIATIGDVLPSSHLASLGRTMAAGRVPDPIDIAVLAIWTVAIGTLAAWRYAADERSSRA